MSRAKNQTVVIVRTELAAAVHERLHFDRSVKVFGAADATKAFSTIAKMQLPVIALDRKFVTSPSGAQFVTQLRSAHPDFEIRVLVDEGSEVPLVLRRPVQADGRDTVTAGSQILVGDVRRAPRFAVRPGSEACVNGQPTALIDVSVAGAQVLSPVVLRPTQAVRVALADDIDLIALRADVVWSMFERSKKTGETHYRAGVQFTDAEQRMLEAYCTRHGITA